MEMQLFVAAAAALEYKNTLSACGLSCKHDAPPKRK